jgi:hypothetical protein
MANVSKGREWLMAHRDYPHEDRCLIWPFTRDKREGRARVGRFLAHRVMCEIVNGPAPADKPQSAHSCGNGDQGCVNPRHLSWASNSDNQIQRYAHGRASFHRQGNRSRFTSVQIADIRAKYGEFTQEALAEIYGVTIPTIQYYLKYRETRGHANGKVNHWREDEIEKLRAGIDRGMKFKELASFIGRPISAVEMKTYRLGLASGRPAPRRSTYQ